MIRTVETEIPPLVPEGAGFAFGASPFHAKGVLYLGTQSFFEMHFRGGVAAFAAEIEQPELREFIAQKFLPSSFYDVMPVPALIAYEARALRMSLDEYLLHRTRWQARKDLGGIYGWALKLATPGMVATRLPKVFCQMFDFAIASPSTEEDGRVTTLIGGVPAPLERWLNVALGVYIETALKLAGARNVDSKLSVDPDGERAGVPLLRLTIDVGWS